MNEEWIWVEGYKGMTEKMQSRHNNFQYELGNVYSMGSEEIKLCEKGFHFSLQLQDVFTYYDVIEDNRFFKVRGLVKKSDFDNYCIDFHDKIVAKQIEIVEEINNVEIMQALYKYLGKCRKLPEFFYPICRTYGYKEALKDFKCYELKNAGYDPHMAEYWSNNLTDEILYDKIVAVGYQEGLSMDIKFKYIFDIK